MKKVLFILPSFAIGGTTVSTRNLISVLDKEKYDITVWALNPEGVLKWMYDGIPLIASDCIAKSFALESWQSAKSTHQRVLALILRLLAKRKRIRQLLIRKSVNSCIRNCGFDTVAACQEALSTYFAAAVPRNNRVAWIRCDYKRYFEEFLDKKLEPVYYQYKHIVCVSEGTCDGFIDLYPKLSERVVCIQNPQDSSMIISQSDIDDGDSRFQTDKKVIVSVGRLNKVKRFVEIPRIARGLIEEGLLFKWYIIGDGDQEAAIKESIERNDVSGSVIMLGAKSNPHFYIKNADLYVCLSSSEACPRVVNEAKILGTPVVSTDFPTIYEYIEDGVNGKIVPLEGVKDAIIELMSDKALYNCIKDKIEGFTFDNKGLIDQLERIL